MCAQGSGIFSTRLLAGISFYSSGTLIQKGSVVVSVTGNDCTGTSALSVDGRRLIDRAGSCQASILTRPRSRTRKRAASRSPSPAMIAVVRRREWTPHEVTALCLSIATLIHHHHQSGAYLATTRNLAPLIQLFGTTKIHLNGGQGSNGASPSSLLCECR